MRAGVGFWPESRSSSAICPSKRRRANAGTRSHAGLPQTLPRVWANSFMLGVWGAQILKVTIDFDSLLHRGYSRPDALHQLQENKALYNPDILQIVAKLEVEEEQEKIIAVDVRGMTVGMIVAQDIMASNGVLIVPKGQEVTWSLLQGLQNFSHQVEIQEPILVRVKIEKERN